jgi:hypothetical protein
MILINGNKITKEFMYLLDRRGFVSCGQLLEIIRTADVGKV